MRPSKARDFGVTAQLIGQVVRFTALQPVACARLLTRGGLLPSSELDRLARRLTVCLGP